MFEWYLVDNQSYVRGGGRQEGILKHQSISAITNLYLCECLGLDCLGQGTIHLAWLNKHIKDENIWKKGAKNEGKVIMISYTSWHGLALKIWAHFGIYY